MRGGLCESAHQSILLAKQENVIVEAADNAEEDDAGYGNPHCHTLGACRLECGNDRFVIAEEHCLDHEEIVEERHDGVDQRYQHKDVDCYGSLLESSGEDEELAEESGEGGYTCQ